MPSPLRFFGNASLRGTLPKERNTGIAPHFLGNSPMPKERRFAVNRRLGRRIEPYIWLLPSIVLLAIFMVYPIIIVFKLSFSEISKSGVIGGFVGLQNYKDAVSLPAFGTVMKNTFWWVVAVVGISTLLGFIIALVLNEKFHGRKIARSIIVFPWATSLVVQASVWNYIIKYEYGNLNNILLNLGIIREAINWRSSFQVEFIWEIWVGIFVTIPFVTFCVLSGLQSIDTTLYEAADIDGASFWDKLFNITIPLVKPSLTVSTVLNIIYVFNSFPIVFTMTKGAPANNTDTLITYLYMLNFYDRKKGPATALSVIGFLILCVCAGIYMVTVMKKEENQ